MIDILDTEIKIGDSVWFPHGAKLLHGKIIMKNNRDYVCIRHNGKSIVKRSIQTIKAQDSA